MVTGEQEFTNGSIKVSGFLLRIVMHQKSLMPIRIPLFPELSSGFRPRGGGKHIRERTAKWPFIERPLHFDLF
jgi:hypothetical protein